MRTLLDRMKAKRPERRTALIARELKRYNIPIVALSETRFATLLLQTSSSTLDSLYYLVFFWFC